MSGTRLKPGEIFAGRYTIERSIGRGGMGAVYLATQSDLGREVAIKILRPDRAEDDVVVERFRNEAKIIAQLGHPHIVAIHDFGETEDGVLYLVMERLRGHTLGRTLDQGRLEPARALGVGRDVARALSAAHARGVVHRDLKPDNIFLVEAESVRDFVKVLDFGIAKLTGEEEMNLTGAGLVAGTPGYIPPEQVMGKAPDDPRGDLYSLGVVLFEMLTGQRPFDGDSAMKLFLRQLEEDAPAIPEVAPELELPPGVAELVRDLLARDIEARPGSAEEVIARLDALGAPPPTRLTPDDTQRPIAVDDLSPTDPTVPDTPSLSPKLVEAPGPATPVATTTATPRPLPARASRRRTYLAAAVVAVVLIGAVIAWRLAMHRHHSVEDAPELMTFPVGLELKDRFTRALSAYLDGDLRGATLLVASAQADHPDEPAFRFLSGELLRRRGDILAGTPLLLEAAHRIEAERPDWCKDDGAVAVAVRDAYAAPERVVDIYRGCAPCQASPLGHVLLARTVDSLKLDLQDEARFLIDEGIRRFPDTPLLHADKVMLLLRHLDLEAAERALKAGQAAAADSPGIRAAEIEVLIARGDLDPARSALMSLIAEGAGAELALRVAHLDLLRGDDDEARAGVRAYLRLLPDAIRAQHELAFAEMEIGAGRVDDAGRRLRRLTREALARGDTHTATFLILRGLEALDSARDKQEARGLLALATDALTEVNIRPGDRDYLAAIRQVALGTEAADEGRLDEARAILEKLEARGLEQLRASWRLGLPAYLHYRLALATNDADRARANARRLSHPCQVKLAMAEAELLPSGNGDAGEAALRELVARADVCQAITFGGAYAHRAFALLAERELARGDREAARALVDEAARRFPARDDRLLAAQRLVAVSAKLAR